MFNQFEAGYEVEMLRLLCGQLLGGDRFVMHRRGLGGGVTTRDFDQVCGRIDGGDMRAAARQRDIFDGALRDPYRFAETLARISALVGADRVGTPQLENTRRPDAFQLGTPPPVLAQEPSVAIHPPQGLPLRRFRPPHPATVELAGPAPAYVWTASCHGRVTRLAGPWYAAGGWWQRAQGWQREEWDVELEPAGLYRLVHTPDGWFVEGEYD